MTLIRPGPLALCLALAGLLAAPAGAQQKAVDRAAVEAAFAKADVNSDGKLTKEEASRLPEIAARFDAMDRNKDGVLDLAEFASGYGPPSAPVQASRASFSLFQ